MLIRLTKTHKGHAAGESFRVEGSLGRRLVAEGVAVEIPTKRRLGKTVRTATTQAAEVR